MGAVLEDPKVVKTNSTEVRFSVELDSKGCCGYPAVIELSPLKVRDFKILASSDISDVIYIRRLLDVLQRTIVTPGVIASDLTRQDFTQLIIAHKVNATGPTYEVVISCPSCNSKKRFPYVIKLLELPSKPLSPDFKEPTDIEGYKVRLPRVGLYQKVKIEDENFDIALIESACNINPKFSIEDMSLKAFKAVREFIADNDYGVDTNTSAICPECQEVVTFSVPFRSDFFIS